MDKNIKSIFDAHGAGISIDRNLLKALRDYGNHFINSSENHINFFGGHAIGVYPVRFKTSDRHEFLIDILGLEEGEIRAEIKALDTVNEEWIRGTDAMNLACLWLAHRFRNSSLSGKEIYEAMYQSMLILNFKFITSLMAHFFPHPVNPELSQMIYDQLSFKYTLKKEGSWMGVMKERANDIVDEKGIHASTIHKFDDDADIQYMVTDIQGRLRSIIKNLWDVLSDIKEKDIKRHRLSYFSELEGEIVIKDMSKKYSSYRDYIEQVAGSLASEFIKPELIKVVVSMLPTLPAPLLGEALIAFHHQYGLNNKGVVEWFDLISIHCFERVLTNPKQAKSIHNIPELLTFMKSLYMASKRNDDVEKMCVLGDKFVKKFVKNNNSSVIASVRSGVMLYILLRMFSKDHYG